MQYSGKDIDRYRSPTTVTLLIEYPTVSLCRMRILIYTVPYYSNPSISLQENQLVVFADDLTPRYVTSVCILDYHTVAVGDKFGTVSIVSLHPRTAHHSGYCSHTTHHNNRWLNGEGGVRTSFDRLCVCSTRR